MKFKVNDVVKCISDVGFKPYIIKGNYYRVISIEKSHNAKFEWLGLETEVPFPSSPKITKGKYAHWHSTCFELVLTGNYDKKAFDVLFKKTGK